MNMRKVIFRVRNFDKEQYLTFNIDNNASLDEELFDFLENEEPKGIVPIIFEEGEEFDTFSFNITDKIHLIDISNQEITAEMVLRVLHSLVLAFIDMAEYRVPLSYLVLNRNYIYVDSDYHIEFICIPLEDMNDDADVNMFLRNLIASLRFDSSENGDYVARLLSYVNNYAIFNLRNMVTLIEELMDEMNVEIPEGESADIYVDCHDVEEEEQTIYREESEDEASFEEALDEEHFETEEQGVDVPVSNAEEFIEDIEEGKTLKFELEREEDVFEESFDNLQDEKNFYEEEEEISQEEALSEDTYEIDLIEIPEDKEQTGAEMDEFVLEDIPSEDSKQKKSIFKTKETPSTGIVIEDDFDEFLAEKEREEKRLQNGDSGLKIKKNIKINRTAILKSTQEETRPEEPEEAESEEERDQTTVLSQKMAPPPKVNPYLIRVNTEERVVITKQSFKLGKASMGVDYSIKGNSAVSRVHAIIINKDNEYYIQDHKSLNHTYVDGKMVAEGENELLTHGCKIMLGNEEFVFKLS